MNYTDIKDLALSYSDRSDTETINNVDNFLKIVEARVNRKLKTMDMATRQNVNCVTGQEYLDLPSDFGGAREIKFKTSAGAVKSMDIAAPEFLDGIQGIANLAKIYYCIVADQIRVLPLQDTGDFIEIVYHKRVPALASGTPNNWLSDDHPDCYTFGLMVEISAYVKDAEAAALWDQRFKESIDDIEYDDAVSKHAGQPLKMKVG